MDSPLARIAADFDGAFGAAAQAGHATLRRRRALEVLTACGLPVQRDENWRYASLRALDRARFASATPLAPAAAELAGLAPPIDGFRRYVFVDGVLLPGVSAPAAAGPATLRELEPGEAEAAWPAAALAPDQRFSLLNAAFATGAVRIEAGPGTQDRIELVFASCADASQGASYPTVQLQLDEAARLTLIERHVSLGDRSALVISAVGARLAAQARLTHYRLQNLNSRSVLLDTLCAEIARDGSCHLRCIGSGAQAARSTLAVELAGARAEVDVAVAALGDRQQVQDTYAVVTHRAAQGRTTQTFRGIAAGRARIACNGKIVVSRQGVQADSQQSLRGLLTGAQAEVDLRPQLEIHTDAVRCTHGATSGKLDEHMLFYLLSRGLDRDSATRLLKWAFLEDVIAQIGEPALRRQIETQLVGSLGDETLKELL